MRIFTNGNGDMFVRFIDYIGLALFGRVGTEEFQSLRSMKASFYEGTF